jgi:hypothetical protein
MNILPFVFSFLLIFALFSHMLMRDDIALSSSKQKVCSYLEAKQALKCQWEAYVYSLCGKKETPTFPSKQNTPAQKSPLHSYSSPRFEARYTIKWNLLPLIDSSKKDPYLESACARLLEKMYSHTLFWEKAALVRKDLAKELIAAFTQKDRVEELSDLFPQDEVLQKVFYKMLQGSGRYDIEKKRGHPPLKDFFCIDAKSKKSIYLPQASYYALEALLGEALSKQIVQLEEGKWRKTNKKLSISTKELSELLEASDTPLSLKEVKSFTYLSRKEAPPMELVTKTKDLTLKLSTPALDP